jgi:hypothetical protein
MTSMTMVGIWVASALFVGGGLLALSVFAL